MTRNPILRATAGIPARSCLFVQALLLVWLVIPDSAEAIPAFARREGQGCNFCHQPYPKLNSTGMSYQANGFRFPGQKPQNLWDMRGGPPLAVIAEIEAYIDRKEPNNGPTQNDGPDIKIDELEVMAAGNMSGRVSAFAEVEFPSDNNFSPEIGKTWLQVNDLVGDEGQLNIRLGKTVVDLPFLSQDRRIVRNKWLASERLGLLNDEVGVMATGQTLGDDEDAPIHRYGAGIVRADQGSATGQPNNGGSANRFLRGIGYYAIEFPGRTHLGTIVSGGHGSDSTNGDYRDVSFLVAGEKTFETDCGTLTADLLYGFRALEFQNSQPSGEDNQLFHNAAVNLLYSPVPEWVVGTRVDWLIETKQKGVSAHNDDGWRLSQTVRWNVIQNTWIGIEYRHEEGGAGSPVTSNQSTDKGRLFGTVAF